MTLTVKHPFTSAIADDPTAAAAGDVLPSHWNANHTVTGSVDATQMPALTGDVTTVAGAVATTLSTVNSNVGTFGDATHVAQVTVNGKGLVTAASSVAITASATPGGSSGQVQYNNAGAFGGTAATYAGTTFTFGNLTIDTSAFGQIIIGGNADTYIGGGPGGNGARLLPSGIQLSPSATLTWGNLNNSSAKDTGIARNAAGVIEVNSGSSGSFADITARAFINNGVTVSGLPGTPVTGMTAYVTDGTGALAWGATVTGGGSTKYLVWYNGANWTVAGK